MSLDNEFSMRHSRKMPGSHSGGVSAFSAVATDNSKSTWLLSPSILFFVYYGVDDMRVARISHRQNIFLRDSKFSTSLVSVFFLDCCVVVKPQRFMRVQRDSSFSNGSANFFSHFPGKSFSMAMSREFDNRMIDLFGETGNG